mgnify:FL=1
MIKNVYDNEEQVYIAKVEAYCMEMRKHVWTRLNRR